MDEVSCGDKYVHLRMSLVSFICPILCIGIFMQGYIIEELVQLGEKKKSNLKLVKKLLKKYR